MTTRTVIILATSAVVALGLAVGYFLFPWGDYFGPIDPDILDPAVCGNSILDGSEQCDPTACTTGSDGVFCGSLTACAAGQLCDPETCTCESYVSANCGR